MVDQIFLYVGAALPFLWGVAHLFPTKSVVRGFGDISLDNQRIITMEWIVEGVALIAIGIIVAVATYVDPDNEVSTAVYWVCFLTLNALSIVSLTTGFKIKFVPFKLCPVIFTTSSVLILAGSYV